MGAVGGLSSRPQYAFLLYFYEPFCFPWDENKNVQKWFAGIQMGFVKLNNLIWSINKCAYEWKCFNCALRRAKNYGAKCYSIWFSKHFNGLPEFSFWFLVNINNSPWQPVRRSHSRICIMNYKLIEKYGNVNNAIRPICPVMLPERNH